MNKTQRATLIFLAIAVAASGLTGCNDPGYKITGDNKKEIEQYPVNREHAIAHLLKTNSYVDEMKEMKSLPVGADLPAQHRKMHALRLEGDPLGVTSLLSHCRSAGYKAYDYWMVVAGSDRFDTLETSLAKYVEEAKKCQGQIDNGPKSMTYLEMAIDKNPPADGCSRVSSQDSEKKTQSWYCPTELLSKK